MKKMHGIISPLDKEHSQKVKEIWQRLDEKCGYTEIASTITPHFSWAIAETFDWLALKNTLEEISEEIPPFTLHTNGIGIFSWVRPVIYIPLVRTTALSKVHQQIWTRVEKLSPNISPYYAPKNWLPHISLAFMDVAPDNISCAMQELAFETLHWEIKIDKISFTYRDDADTKKAYHEFKFRGNK